MSYIKKRFASLRLIDAGTVQNPEAVPNKIIKRKLTSDNDDQTVEVHGCIQTAVKDDVPVVTTANDASVDFTAKPDPVETIVKADPVNVTAKTESVDTSEADSADGTSNAGQLVYLQFNTDDTTEVCHVKFVGHPIADKVDRMPNSYRDRYFANYNEDEDPDLM